VEVEEGSGVTRNRQTGDAEGPNPLYVVDGVIISDPDFMSTLDPDQIEKVEVIKGTVAETRYGERGANGVVLITTKRG
jgi:TonB-dependent SusC/RagA subfamily outer membrane receptor